MRKKKKILIIVPIIVVLIAVAAFVGIYIHKKTETEGAENVVDDFFAGYQDKDPTITKNLVGMMEKEAFGFEGYSAIFADEFMYEIKGAEKLDDGWYKVDVITSTVDFGKLFDAAYQHAVDQYGEEGAPGNFENALKEVMKDPDLEMKEYDYSVAVIQIGEEYKIQMESTMADSLTGGMNAYLYSLQSEGGE